MTYSEARQILADARATGAAYRPIDDAEMRLLAEAAITVRTHRAR